MSKIGIKINGKDAFSYWGVTTTTNTLSALLAPLPLKDYPTFNSRLEHGIRVDTSDPKVANRDLNLEIQMIAKSPEEFYSRLTAFYSELEKGAFTLVLTDRPSVVYHLIYSSCAQFTQFCRGIATLSLKCSEPNPKNRK